MASHRDGRMCTKASLTVHREPRSSQAKVAPPPPPPPEAWLEEIAQQLRRLEKGSQKHLPKAPVLVLACPSSPRRQLRKDLLS